MSDDLMVGFEITHQSFNLVNSGVFVVVDEDTKEVFISCSNNLFKGISSVVTRIMEQDYCIKYSDNVKIVVKYIGKNPRIFGSKLIEEYDQMGYKVMNKVKPIQLTVKYRSLPYEDRFVEVVTLRSNRGNEEIVGAFESKDDAVDWVLGTYPEGIISDILYLDNALTKEVKLRYNG